MLSRRDKLLIRPWQERRYDYHRRKVQSALPAIDNRPPPMRNHVSIKLKKQQKENERISKIENDNLILLKKMSYIMRTSRVDNNWTTPQPNFLNRVAIYDTSGIKDIYIDVESPPLKGEHIRKSRCTACTPQKAPQPIVPEQRVPWEPEKPTASRRRAKSVPPRKLSLPTISEKESDVPEKRPMIKQKSAGSRTRSSKKISSRRTSATDYEKSLKSPQSITLSRGCLKLSVNFPPDTLVKLQDGQSERLLFGGNCFCKSLTKVC